MPFWSLFGFKGDLNRPSEKESYIITILVLELSSGSVTELAFHESKKKVKLTLLLLLVFHGSSAICMCWYTLSYDGRQFEMFLVIFRLKGNLNRSLESS